MDLNELKKLCDAKRYVANPLCKPCVDRSAYISVNPKVIKTMIAAFEQMKERTIQHRRKTCSCHYCQMLKKLDEVLNSNE